jgi:hypothetical protein
MEVNEMNIKQMFFITAIILVNINCDDNPIKSENRSPVILSLTVFPEIIHPSDSAIVICNAMDPDGDTLVYDWITDGRLKIKGGQDQGHFLYHTYENSRIIYHQNLPNRPPVDTLWVQCFTRDVKGGGDNKVIFFLVIKN